MPKVAVTKDTRKDRDALWAVISDFPNIARWASGVSASHATSDATEGVGATRQCELPHGGMLEETIREWEVGRRVVISIDEAKKVPFQRATATFRIDDAGVGYIIVMEADYTLKGGALGRLVAPLLKPALRRSYRSILEEWDRAA